MPTQILASPCGDRDPWPRELVHARYDWPETWNVCGAWWSSGCAAVDSTWCWLVMAMIRMQVCWWYLLRHSCYFDFYFEHSNFT